MPTLLNTARAQVADRPGIVQIIPQVPTQELIDAGVGVTKIRGEAIELLIDGIAEGPCGFSNHLRDWARHLTKYGVKVHIPNNRGSEYPEIAKMKIDPNDKNIKPIELLIYAGGGFHKKNPNRTVIGYTVFEVVKFPSYFKDNAENVDFLWTASKFCVDRFLQLGVPKDKVELFPEGVDIELFNPYVPPSLKTTDFLFGSVIGWSERKGISTLLNAYLKEFDSREKVTLYISGGWYAKEVAEKEVEEIKKSIRKANFPKVVLDWRDRSDWEMPALFNSFNCLCYPTLGEGYCRPIAESLSCGVPVITTDAPPMNEIVSKDVGYPIMVDKVAPEPRADWICDFYKGADFFHPSEDHLRSLMREVFEHRDEAKVKAMRGRQFIKKEHNVSFIIEDVVKRLQEIHKR